MTRSLAIKCPACERFVEWANNGPGLYLLPSHTTEPAPVDGRLALWTDDPNDPALCRGSGCLGFTAVLSRGDATSF